jgi:hypothetical protein
VRGRWIRSSSESERARCFRRPRRCARFYLDPYSGAVLGSREWGNILEGKKNLMPFVYRLH